MVNVRRGINIRVGFSVYRNGIPEDTAEAQNIRVVIRHKSLPNSSAAFTGSAVKIEGNSVSVVVSDIMQRTMASGAYLIEVAYRLINPLAPEGYDPYIIDSDVFTLTDRSSDVGGVSCGDVTVQVVNISGEVSFCSQALEQLIDEAITTIQSANGATQAANDAADAAMAIVDSKVNIDGLNANVKRLQFDTNNPTAPMQIGQIAWDNDEHTLVTHDGLHSHPLGKELELRARNTSGATILNGRACYVTGSTGDNPTIALATNTNGDIAQKTIGVATMDIANNAFGIVTTFGEVNGIDTSALTLGAIVYLGANGTLTTTEPVAPTPKIVVGLCVRQHAQVGKLFVSTRPIARLSKLSEVHAPTLTDNDVLRYNGTTLRWEVYSLAGKADLVGGKVPSAQLPAYVDDVLEYANLAAFPATGETDKIYVALNANLIYRWSGTTYVEISKSLALGETADTAYRGDRGKTAYDHSQTTGNPHNTTAAQIQNTPAGTVAATTVQGAINELASDIVQVETDLNNKLKYKADLLNGTVPAEQLPPDLIRTTLHLTQVGHRKRRIQDSFGVEDGTMLWSIVSGTEYLAALSETLGLGLYLVSQDLSTYKKLSKTNSTLYADGTHAMLDGAEGDVQMCWRKPIYIKYYEKQEADGLYEHIEISHLNILGECEMIVPGGGFPAVLNRTTGDLRALYSTDPNYRGGNNTASYDSDPIKTLIGKPATNLSAYSGEVAAKKRGELWTTGGTPFFATLAILQIMLFGTNNAQDAIVSDDVLIAGEGFQSCKKTASGLYSGGFGVNNSFPQWSTYNANNPTFDLSAGFPFGDITGRRVYIIKDWPAAGTNQTISLAYFFGMPYPFNHYWHGDAHQRVDQQTEAQGFKTVVYQKRDITAAPISGGPSANGVAPSVPWEKVAEGSRTGGYIRRTSFNALCLFPTVAGSPGASNKFYPDYFYNNGATSFGWRAPVRLASLGDGANAGPFNVYVSSAPTSASALYGAFCCHFSSGIVPKKISI